MNLSYLKYAVEVEKTGSITKAAQNFYMNQPHLSKIIRELERDLGEAIFDRTSRGMIPTKKGEEFLRYARTIMAQEEQIEALCTRNRESALEFRFCGPRATYIACAFTEFLCSTDTRFAVNIHYMETNSKNVIRLVSSKEFDLGIVRCQSVYEPYYQKLFQEENLESSLLWEFSSRLLMLADHPLAKKTGLTYLDLNDSIEILQGDSKDPSFSFETQAVSSTGGNSRRCISVYDRSSQFALLRRLPGAYMWTSPIPYRELAQEGLIQRPCAYPGNLHRDLLICRRGCRMNQPEKEVIQSLNRMVSQLSD